MPQGYDLSPELRSLGTIGEPNRAVRAAQRHTACPTVMQLMIIRETSIKRYLCTKTAQLGLLSFPILCTPAMQGTQ